MGVCMEVEAKIVMFFAALGAMAGCFSSLVSRFHASNPIRGAGIALLLALCLFYVSYKLTLSYKLAPRMFKVMPGQFPGGSRKVATTGIMNFFIMWLIFWIMVYNLTL